MAGFVHKDSLEIEGDMREAYFAWLANLEGVSIKEKLDMVDTHLAINIDEVEEISPHAILISPGPGNPKQAGISIDIIKWAAGKIPVLGICLGHQILALALGAKTETMHHGHRGANHPVKNLIKGNVEITSQNHGFEIVRKNLPRNIQITHQSLFDNSIEGI